jgi:hypothetical protein
MIPDLVVIFLLLLGVAIVAWAVRPADARRRGRPAPPAAAVIVEPAPAETTAVTDPFAHVGSINGPDSREVRG